MKSFVNNIKKHYSFYNLNQQNLETRIGTIFLLSGFLMSLLAFILTFAYGFSFWIVFPNLIMAIICMLIPVFSSDLKKTAYIALILVGLVYYPFVFSIAGGIKGPAPIYFIVIIAYVSLYFEGKKAIYLNFFMITYFLLIVFMGEQYPDLIISNNINFLRTIDIVVSVVTVSIVVSIISAVTFNGYKKLHDRNLLLMKELEIKNNDLKILSTLDQLTGVYNRRYFSEILSKELKHCKNNADKCILLMIDIDDFKKINDKYGHLYGDDVLKIIANEIKGCLNDNDLISRYGGEEFSVIISYHNYENGYDIVEKIRRRIESLKFKDDISVTVSIGGSEYVNGENYESMIKKADDNLYIAKAKGKNCVVK